MEDKTKITLAAIAAVVILVLAALIVGDDDASEPVTTTSTTASTTAEEPSATQEEEGWPTAIREEVIRGCIGKRQTDAATAYCECAADELESLIPLEDILQAKSSQQIYRDFKEEFFEAAEACTGSAGPIS